MEGAPLSPARQTALLQLLDLFLGVAHKSETASFQQEMRDEYLPLKHAALLRDVGARLRASGSARDAAARTDAPARLRDAHSDALRALAAVRAFHLGIASRYLRRTGTGTGGSDFRTMLDEAVQATRKSVVA